MCRPTTCRKCSKTTWAGCGNHVQDVMRHIPKNERCSCSADAPKEKSAGWLSRLFGGK